MPHRGPLRIKLTVFKANTDVDEVVREHIIEDWLKDDEKQKTWIHRLQIWAFNNECGIELTKLDEAA